MNNVTDSAQKVSKRILSYFILFAILSIGFFLLEAVTWQSNQQNHTIIEIIAALLAFFVGSMALTRFYSKKEKTFLLIGIGFLGTGLLDGYHAIVTATFFEHYFPVAPAHLIPWSWFASRLYLAILLCLSVWIGYQQVYKISEGVIYSFFSLLMLGSLLFFIVVPLPPAYYPDGLLHRPAELLPGFFFLLALVMFLKKEQWRQTNDFFTHWLILAMIINAMSQIMFMPFSEQIFDVWFNATHWLKNISYLCVLIGLFIDMYRVFIRSEQTLRALSVANEQLQHEVAEREQAYRETFLITQALNNVAVGVLITDNLDNVKYINQSAYRLFQQKEDSIRDTIPAFRANTLLGLPIRQLFQHLTTPLTTTHHALLVLGTLKLEVHITPVMDATAQRLGSVIELRDRTAEIAVEQEINAVTCAASQGDFSYHFDTRDKTGFFSTLGEALNQILSYNQCMIRELRQVFAAIAQGDLSQTVTQVYAGDLQQLKEDVNTTVLTLTHVMTALQKAADAASQGDFSQQIDLSDKKGFFETFSVSLNQILTVNSRLLAELWHVFSAITEGDLTQTMSQTYSGTLEQLKNEVNTTIATLTNVINVVKQTAEAVDNMAEEMLQSNYDLNQRTERQTAFLEQTAASMEQIASTVQQNAENTQQAAKLAANAREKARQGGQVVGSAIIAMNEINCSSRQVSDIISVIDDIAFQTNLLSLNAAVEAARAGEQGRGFAVVATEVRNLAQRSAQAAKEIKKLIQTSVEKIGEGTLLVNQSGYVLQDIVAAVTKVSDLISEIAAAGREQTVGIHQVNKAVAQMDEMTQKNTALVEIVVDSNTVMKEHAQNLKGYVAFFKTQDTRHK